MQKASSCFVTFRVDLARTDASFQYHLISYHRMRAYGILIVASQCRLTRTLPNCTVSNRRELGIPLSLRWSYFQTTRCLEAAPSRKPKIDGLVQAESNQAFIVCRRTGISEAKLWKASYGWITLQRGTKSTMR
jgi:hypothetical protein